MRSLVTPRRAVRENTPPARRVFRGSLAEDYDGIGQYVMVALSQTSTAASFRARIASGDFGTGQTMPQGTPVSVFVNRGQVEILSMGAK